MNFQTTKPRARLSRTGSWFITWPDQRPYVFLHWRTGATLDQALRIAYARRLQRQTGPKP